MKCIHVYLLLLGIMLFAFTPLQAQEDETHSILNPDNLSGAIDLQNNHLWRGLIITDMPVFMAQAGYALDKEKNWEVGFWGASAMARDNDGTHYKEINYYIQYSKNNFYIGLWNLFNSRDIDTDIASDDIFNYSKKRTANILDLRLNYTFGPEFPLYVEADIILYGGAAAGEVLLNSDGSYDKHKHSTYIKLQYPLMKSEDLFDLDAFVGSAFAFNEAPLYGNKDTFQVVNAGIVASRDIKISDNYSIPIHAQFMWNPALNYARMQVGATLFSF